NTRRRVDLSEAARFSQREDTRRTGDGRIRMLVKHAETVAPRACPKPTGAARGPGARLLLFRQILEFNILEGHFHAFTLVQLPGDDPLRRHLFEVPVHGGYAVDFDGHVFADAFDVIVVEIFLLEDLVYLVRRGFLHHAAKVLPPQAAPVAVAHVGLRAGDGIFL